MSLSRDTLMILKNFSQIRPGIAFFPGNKLRTMNVMRQVYAEAIIPEEIPFEFGIADLEDFIATCFDVMGKDKAISVYEGKTIQQIKNPEGFYQYFRGCVKRSMEVQVDGASVESWQ